MTTIVSTFTAYYIHLWSTYFPERPLAPPFLPSFDGRAVIYPSTHILRDYMSWRQVDCMNKYSLFVLSDRAYINIIFQTTDQLRRPYQ